MQRQIVCHVFLEPFYVGVVLVEILRLAGFKGRSLYLFKQRGLPVLEDVADGTRGIPDVADGNAVADLRQIAEGELILDNENFVLRLRQAAVKQLKASERHHLRRHDGNDLVGRVMRGRQHGALHALCGQQLRQRFAVLLAPIQQHDLPASIGFFTLKLGFRLRGRQDDRECGREQEGQHKHDQKQGGFLFAAMSGETRSHSFRQMGVGVRSVYSPLSRPLMVPMTDSLHRR